MISDSEFNRYYREYHRAVADNAARLAVGRGFRAPADDARDAAQTAWERFYTRFDPARGAPLPFLYKALRDYFSEESRRAAARHPHTTDPDAVARIGVPREVAVALPTVRELVRRILADADARDDYLVLMFAMQEDSAGELGATQDLLAEELGCSRAHVARVKAAFRNDRSAALETLIRKYAIPASLFAAGAALVARTADIAARVDVPVGVDAARSAPEASSTVKPGASRTTMAAGAAATLAAVGIVLLVGGNQCRNSEAETAAAAPQPADGITPPDPPYGVVKPMKLEFPFYGSGGRDEVWTPDSLADLNPVTIAIPDEGPLGPELWCFDRGTYYGVPCYPTKQGCVQGRDAYAQRKEVADPEPSACFEGGVRLGDPAKTEFGSCSCGIRSAVPGETIELMTEPDVQLTLRDDIGDDYLLGCSCAARRTDDGAGLVSINSALPIQTGASEQLIQRPGSRSYYWVPPGDPVELRFLQISDIDLFFVAFLRHRLDRTTLDGTSRAFMKVSALPDSVRAPFTLDFPNTQQDALVYLPNLRFGSDEASGSPRYFACQGDRGLIELYAEPGKPLTARVMGDCPLP